ncbi:MAG: Chitobiase/beta-hexosaminidase C-terminal domain [Herbinix sp.]|nr:Chitobiase/beta-hexosaminidase C-terminal domain [Herbinix sp.]
MVVSITIISIALTASISITGNDQVKSAAKLLTLGDKYLSEMNYEEAVDTYKRVTEIDPLSISVYLKIVDGYMGLQQVDQAIEVLQDGIHKIELIQEETNILIEYSEYLYIKISDLYVQSGDRKKAFHFLRRGYVLTRSRLLKVYLRDYYPIVNVFLPSGEYEGEQEIMMSSKGNKIYYTIDKTTPTKESALYQGSIIIGEGETTLSVVAENEFGELGEVQLFHYIIH